LSNKTTGELQSEFKEKYKRRTAKADVDMICAEIKIHPDDFDIWCEDRDFTAALERIDNGRSVRAREMIFRNVFDITEQLVATATVGSGAQQVAAAKTLLEAAKVFTPRGGKELTHEDVAGGTETPVEQLTDEALTNEDARMEVVAARDRVSEPTKFADRGRTAKTAGDQTRVSET
jgi:hypothetical protein